jgi:ubiquinone/menaquinone biosynthesis C-methylase UbiE
VVVSSLAIHNVPGAGERARALREAARVLKKRGKLAIADIRHTRVRRRARGLRAEDHRAPIARRSLLVRLRPLGSDPPGRRNQANTMTGNAVPLLFLRASSAARSSDAKPLPYQPL